MSGGHLCKAEAPTEAAAAEGYSFEFSIFNFQFGLTCNTPQKKASQKGSLFQTAEAYSFSSILSIDLSFLKSISHGLLQSAQLSVWVTVSPGFTVLSSLSDSTSIMLSLV